MLQHGGETRLNVGFSPDYFLISDKTSGLKPDLIANTIPGLKAGVIKRTKRILMKIQTALSDEDILKCWKPLKELRPHLEEAGVSFIDQKHDQ